MSEKNDVINNLRAQLKGAHDWLEGTLMGVDDALANDVWVLNAHCHAGEISTLKGLKGLQGYPG